MSRQIASVIVDGSGNQLSIVDDSGTYRLALPLGAATQATLATLATETKLETVRALLATIDADTSNLNVALSTRATEATLEAARALLATINAKDFATQTTLAALNAKFSALGQKTMAASAPMVVASDQSAIASKNAAASQVDGHSATIGTTTDANTANTVIGRLKQIITKLAGGLPAALTGAGSLKTAIAEAFPAGTNEIGKVAQGTKAIASAAWPVYLTSPAGANVTITTDAGVNRVEIQGKVQTIGAAPPPSTTGVLIYANNPLSVGLGDTDYVIPNGQVFRLQEVVAGNEDPTKGALVSVWYFNGSEHLITRVFTAGFTIPIGYPDVAKAQDGTSMVGNVGGTNVIRVRREKFSGSNIAIVAQVAGYVV